jgi:hypothetical protein
MNMHKNLKKIKPDFGFKIGEKSNFMCYIIFIVCNQHENIGNCFAGIGYLG